MVLFFLSFLFLSEASGQVCSLNSYPHLARPVLEELKRELSQCPPNKVHLTFDDGPHSRFTSQISNELNQRGVKSSFFITTKSLEGARARESQRQIQELMKQGHLIANHGYEHNAYALRIDGSGRVLENGFSESEREFQVNKSIQLLNEASGNQFARQKHLVFRFPYGRGAMPSRAEIQYMHERGLMKFSGNSYEERLGEYRRQSPALITLASQNFSHLAWNHDSGDTSSAFSLSDEGVKNYIKSNIKNLCKSRGTKVSLFHDIKEINTKAIGPIIDIGRCLGLSFISYDELERLKGTLSAGVLIDKNDVDVGVFQTMEELLATVNSAGTVDCQENTSEGSTCYSEYSKSHFSNCQGSSSICYEGRWYSKDDPFVQNKCMNRCYSEYAKKYFENCQGEASVCYEGKWYSKDNQVIRNNCQ